jgi:hypothetical protein
MAIPQVIEKAMHAHQPEPVSTLQVVRRTDGWAREYARDAARELELTA